MNNSVFDLNKIVNLISNNPKIPIFIIVIIFAIALIYLKKGSRR